MRHGAGGRMSAIVEAGGERGRHADAQDLATAARGADDAWVKAPRPPKT
jgi:hypothetical protein